MVVKDGLQDERINKCLHITIVVSVNSYQKVTHYGPHIYSTPGLSFFGKVERPSFDYHYMLHITYMQIYHAA